jgi:hypothetical protein
MIALLPTLFLGAALAAAATPHKRRTTGRVEYATQQRLYLEAGARDGLAAGQTLQLHRNGRAVGTCKIETVVETRATCLGSGQVGDTFDLSPPATPPSAPVKMAAPPEPPEILARRRAALAAAQFEKVDFHAPPQLAAPPRASVTITHTSWLATGAGPWHQERVDVSLRDVSLGGPYTLDVDLSARHWSLRSGPVSFRPEDPTQLYVWEAAISRLPRDAGLALSAGRVRPRSVPGQVILDGAQAGWNTGKGSEAGVFGGAVPDEVTLAPSLTHGTFGAYWAGQHAGSADATLRLFRHEARVAFVNTAALGRRVEGEALIQLWLTRFFEASGNVRIGAGDHQAPGSLDAVRLDGNAQPFEDLSVTGGFRYEGLSIPELDGPGAVRYGGAARHADLSAQWDAAPMLRISAISGLTTDLTSHLTRRWIGPEVGSPRLLGGNAGVSLGYLEEQGWSQGRSGYLQLVTGQRSRVQVLARFSWFHTISGLAPEPTDELALFGSVRAQLARFVSLRLTAMGRSSLNGGRSPFRLPGTQAGWLEADLSGQF